MTEISTSLRISVDNLMLIFKSLAVAMALLTISTFFLTSIFARKNAFMQKSSHHHHMTLANYAKGHTILCFGDSLTFGLVRDDSSQQQHPYALRLSNLLNNQSNIVHSGIPGETLREMVHRLPTVLKSIRDIRVVIILGGTNDLGLRYDFHEIIHHIKKLHEISSTHIESSNSTEFFYNSINPVPIYTVALTIPQSGWSIQNNLKERYIINTAIRNHVASCSNYMTLVDIESLYDQRIPNNNKYWSVDRLHFSALGYDGLGEVIYNTLINTTVALGKLKTENLTCDLKANEKETESNINEEK